VDEARAKLSYNRGYKGLRIFDFGPVMKTTATLIASPSPRPTLFVLHCFKGEGGRISDALDTFSSFFGYLEIFSTILAAIVGYRTQEERRKKMKELGKKKKETGGNTKFLSIEDLFQYKGSNFSSIILSS